MATTNKQIGEIHTAKLPDIVHALPESPNEHDASIVMVESSMTIPIRTSTSDKSSELHRFNINEVDCPRESTQNKYNFERLDFLQTSPSDHPLELCCLQKTNSKFHTNSTVPFKGGGGDTTSIVDKSGKQTQHTSKVHMSKPPQPTTITEYDQKNTKVNQSKQQENNTPSGALNDIPNDAVNNTFECVSNHTLKETYNLTKTDVTEDANSPNSKSSYILRTVYSSEAEGMDPACDSCQTTAIPNNELSQNDKPGFHKSTLNTELSGNYQSGFPTQNHTQLNPHSNIPTRNKFNYHYSLITELSEIPSVEYDELIFESPQINKKFEFGIATQHFNKDCENVKGDNTANEIQLINDLCIELRKYHNVVLKMKVLAVTKDSYISFIEDRLSKTDNLLNDVKIQLSQMKIKLKKVKENSAQKDRQIKNLKSSSEEKETFELKMQNLEKKIRSQNETIVNLKSQVYMNNKELNVVEGLLSESRKEVETLRKNFPKQVSANKRKQIKP